MQQCYNFMRTKKNLHTACFLLLITLIVFNFTNCATERKTFSKKDKTEEEVIVDSDTSPVDDSFKEDSIKQAELAARLKDEERQRQVEQNMYGNYPLINYKRIKIHNKKELDSLQKVFGKKSKNRTAAYKAISTINRKEYRFFRAKDSITVPDTIIDDTRAYSVLPQFYPAVKDSAQFIVVSIKYQCYGAYEYGKLVKFSAVNSGKYKSSNPPGFYYLNWKARHHRSSLDSTWYMPFTFNFTAEGTAFHQYLMPGYPASHGCLRQFYDDAEWLFNWGTTRKRDKVTRKYNRRSGTPILIVDKYDHKTRYKAWRYLKTNREVIDLPEDPYSLEERF